MSDAMSNLADFSQILKIRSRKFLKSSHESRLFISFFRAIEGVNPAIPLCGEDTLAGQRSTTEELQPQHTKTTTFLRQVQQKSHNSTSPKSQITGQNVQ